HGAQSSNVKATPTPGASGASAQSQAHGAKASPSGSASASGSARASPGATNGPNAHTTGSASGYTPFKGGAAPITNALPSLVFSGALAGVVALVAYL
ncbi:hypothetical protein T310_2362, partial [Rasamsonia emersonii CBS 393.64]